MTREEHIGRVIKQVARAYARKSWWVSREDLVQEGWYRVLEAGVATVPDAQLRGWVARVVVRQLKRYMWRESAPVTVCRRQDRDRQVAETFIRAPVIADQYPDHDDPETLAVRQQSAVELPELRAVLITRVRTLYATKSETPNMPALAGVLSVLMHGMKPRESARRNSVPIEDVYQETALVKRLVVRDELSRTLLRRIRECRTSL